jgi:hypothetical protein
MTLGISFTIIGLSLAYALNYGAQIATGAMGPFIIHNSDQLTTTHGYIRCSCLHSRSSHMRACCNPEK